MILQRQIIREIATTSTIVTLILTLIMAGGRLIKYFGYAAVGTYDASLLIPMVAYRLPEFLVLVFPLSFFLSILLVFGRLYVDQEMAVLNSVGVSRERLAGWMWPLILLFFLMQSALMIDFAPWCIRQSDKLFSSQALRSAFDFVQPGEMKTFGNRTIYAQSVSRKEKALSGVFFYQHSTRPDRPDLMLLADRAVKVEDPNEQMTIVDLSNGRRYELWQNSLQYTHTEFSYYRLKLPLEKTLEKTDQDYDAKPFAELLDGPRNSQTKSELGWRIWFPFIIFIAVLLGVPLSEVPPRQGRFLRIIPATLIFASCIFMLSWAKTQVAKGIWFDWSYPLIILSYALLGILITLPSRTGYSLSLKKAVRGSRT